ncbi:MAG: class I SAM-dependent methyltransferase [Desulfobaccales bacterium]
MNHDRVKDEITKRWDYSSQRYDGYHGHGVKSREEAQAWKELFGRLIPGDGQKVLEAGCGTGEMSFLLAEMGHEVYGVDLSEKMLAVAQEKANTMVAGTGDHRLRFKLGDAENPPFEDSCFDVVVCRHLLWTLPSPQTAVDSWKRLLKENGKVIVIDCLWNDDRLATRLRRKIGAWLILLIEKNDLSKDSYSPELEAALPHPKGVPLEDAEGYLAEAGLQSIQAAKLDHLIDIQRKHMPFRYRIGYKYNYYAVSGQKRSIW